MAAMTDNSAKQSNNPIESAPVPALMLDKALIGGQWVTDKNAQTFEVINPANNEIVGTVPDLSAIDVEIAVTAAHGAFELWRNVLPLERGKIMRRWAGLMVEHADQLALLMACEQGKPLGEAKGEILGSAATIEWCAEEGRRLYGEYIDGHKAGTKILISRQPVGVVGAITPWNFPASMITRKVGPAIAAGCAVVLKPAAATPLTALALGKLAQEAGLPDGVLNILTSKKSSEIGKALTSDPRVRKISFTGSTETGRVLMAQAAEHIQKISLELGGNAPFIVFESADLAKAVDGAVASKFRNAGQTCICANRIFVHKNIYKDFLDHFSAKIGALKAGPGWHEDITIGPLINTQALEKVEKMVESSRAAGARVLLGGQRMGEAGHFYQPTLMTDVADNDCLARDEIFGPVAVVYPFEHDEDAIKRANDTPYGLSAYIYTQNLKQALTVSDLLDYGMVGINEPLLSSDLAPFGGVKESGIGREGGRYGLLEYTDIKYRLIG